MLLKLCVGFLPYAYRQYSDRHHNALLAGESLSFKGQLGFGGTTQAAARANVMRQAHKAHKQYWCYFVDM